MNDSMHHQLPGIAARLNLEKRGEMEGSSVYVIREPWKIAVFTAEAGVAQARTPRELADALADESVHSIFIPRFTIVYAVLETLLLRASTPKVIFWEE